MSKERTMDNFFRTENELGKIESLSDKSTDAKSATSLPKGQVSSKVYGDYYDVSTTITTAGATDPNDSNSAVYNRERIFEVVERNAEKLLVTNDGSDTMYIVVSHNGGVSFSKEVPLYAGESKIYDNVYELKLRSPTAGNTYRVMEYELSPTGVPENLKQLAQVQDWTAVAQNTIVKSAEFDFSKMTDGILSIQAALDTTTAHTGTKFIVQISNSSSGDEDWNEYTNFVGLIGTANSEAITNNPLAAGSTTITCADTTGYTVLGNWRFIEDATLADSELIFQTAVTTNTNITILDGTTNAHIQNTLMFNVALTQVISITKPVYRLRVVVDNTYDADGSTLNYKVRMESVV